MRALLGLVLVLAALWSGYWVVGKTAVEQGYAAFMASAPDAGLQVSDAGHSVVGFPNRFDLTVTEPRVTDARTGVAWQAPFVQVFSLSYKPWHVIAAFAPEQRLTTALQDITLRSDKMQASVVVTPGTDLALDRITLVGGDFAAQSNLGWSVAAADLRFALRADQTRSNAYDIGLEALQITPDATLAAMLPALPAVIAATKLDAVASLTAPINRFAGQSRPQVATLLLREGSLTWGDLTVFAKGEVANVAGVAEGRIDIRVTGWRNLVTLATTAGLIKPEVAPTAIGMLEAFATGSGDPNVLQLPLVFADGRMSLGPLPLGPAPRFD